MPHHIVIYSGIFQNTLPGRPDLSGKGVAIMPAVDDEPDLLASFMRPAARSSTECASLEHFTHKKPASASMQKPPSEVQR
jgi:hypothetical protein